MEAASSHVPVVAIASQIPSELIGRGRGYLHEATDQLASFRPLVKHAVRAGSAAAIPDLLAQAWRIALTPPSGPVYVEVPVDLLSEPADTLPVVQLSAEPVRYAAGAEAISAAAVRLRAAEQPVIWAGGGIIRAGAQAELRELAQRLDAPVAMTYMGKGAVPDEHPLAAGSGCDEAALRELLTEADVLLCVGTELGAETTGQYALRPSGTLIHLDAAPERVGATFPSLALVGDAKLTLRALLEELEPRSAASGATSRVDGLRERIRAGLDAQHRETELGLLETIERNLPPDAISTWDMTILAYWAAAHLRLQEGQQFLYPLGSGTLGYAWPAALGAAIAHPDRPVLAVVGDGGLQYALGELGTAAQHRVCAKLLVVDDGGYGILREYQEEAFGVNTAVDLPGSDLAALVAAFGVAVRSATPETLAEQLAWALEQDGPAAVVLRAKIVAPVPTR
jgi:acetolactate synthase-1/2/3 large subunit